MQTAAYLPEGTRNRMVTLGCDKRLYFLNIKNIRLQLSHLLQELLPSD